MRTICCNNKKKTTYILIAICVLQLFLALFWANKKSYLFMDELFSYVTSNRAEGIEEELPANEWLDESWLTEYMSADSEHRFEYGIPYRNQDADVHPPLFYLFLHTACSLIPEEFSYMAGTGCNILFFIGSTIALYFLGKELFKSKACGLLSAFLYSISYGGLNTMTFIRMYMLLTLILILHTFVYLKYFEQDEIPPKGYLLLGMTVIAGTLTQYYFVIIAFFFGVWYAIKFLYKKQYKQLGKYIATAGLSAGCCLAIYPTMLKHIFGTSRGVEARENFASSEGYLEKLRTMWKLLDSQLFFNLFLLVLAVLAFLAAAVYFKKKEKPDRELCMTSGMILFACAGYFMVVTKIAPYQIDRYLMPIYPLIYMIIIGAAYRLAVNLMPKNLAAVLCILGFGGLSAVHMIHSAIPYTYSEDIVITPRLTLAEEYQDNYAIYIRERESDIPKYYDILQVLSKYKGYYYIDDLTMIDEIEEDMECLEGESQVVLYVDQDVDQEKAEMIAQTIFSGAELGKNELLHKDETWDVYLLKNE